MPVYRIYVEKRPGFDVEAAALLADLRGVLGVGSVTGLRLLNRYDVEGLDGESFARCVPLVFTEPPLDLSYDALPAADAVLAVEPLPGQFDQRADSCAECIQLVTMGERPAVRTARVYLLSGAVSPAELARIKKYLINPVECREAALEKPETLAGGYPAPPDVEVLDGFRSLEGPALEAFVAARGLAMDAADAACCRDYFRREGRDPTVTELRVLDTYWSDHCRHTTFGAVLDEVVVEDPEASRAWALYLRLREELGRGDKPVTLMDMATIGARWLRRAGKLEALDESEEINACSVRIRVDNDGADEDWLLMFKNETHNHPTEIEPFGGAATCIGGAIRDPLSGRSYVYQAMRVTGAADPLAPVSATLPGKLPQRKLVTASAAGYSAYGNQIGLATGLVDEIYHPGYAAKRMEIGAVVGAAPAAQVRRERPEPGDLVVLLGGRTGRDGCGGATGSSKAHGLSSLESCGAEVQKGNAPVERKLQRLFRNGAVTRLIKRCNDFGAGGVSVAVGELADGLEIDLDAVPRKYDGLDGTELAISESQERMAVVLAPADLDAFLAHAARENLEATVVARVPAAPRLRMSWRGRTIVDLSRAFLDTNGAAKHARARVPAAAVQDASPRTSGPLEARLRALMGDLGCCARRGLAERFDSTIGAGTVLMPFGGARQRTPEQVMCAKLPVLGETATCSAMAWGFDPYISEQSPYRGAYLAVAASAMKLVAAGFSRRAMYLSFQEYFERLRDEPERWGKPVAALLGALRAQLDLGLAAIGGKDSMSGSFEALDVPPTLVSFAVAVGRTENVVGSAFQAAGSRVALLEADPFDAAAFPALLDELEALCARGAVRAARVAGHGGLAEALFCMCAGNGLGFELDAGLDAGLLFGWRHGAVVLELAPGETAGRTLGRTLPDYVLRAGGERAALDRVQAAWEAKLEPVFPCLAAPGGGTAEQPPALAFHAERRAAPKVGVARPRALVPVFPGTNCEYDTARALRRAGAEPEVLVVRNLSPADVAGSAAAMRAALDRCQMLVLPGGFSGGDEPDGSGKLICAFFRAPAVAEAVTRLLEARDGLVLGICNGFQALIKLGLVPFGRILDTDAGCPTLTFNAIGRHQSRLARTRVASDLSPWLSRCRVGDVHTVAVSHGEGRFVCPPALLDRLAQNGQLAAQYCDASGVPAMDVAVNPNGSALAVEALTSPDGRVLGKMGHSERSGAGLYKNVPGDRFQPIFEGGVDYFRL